MLRVFAAGGDGDVGGSGSSCDGGSDGVFCGECDRMRRGVDTGPLWSGINKNRDVSTGPLARPFARSLAPLPRSLAPDCSLRSRPPLRSLVRSLAQFTHSLARGRVNF